MDDAPNTEGLRLDSFVEELHRVPEKFNKHPVASFDVLERMGEPASRYIDARWDEGWKFDEISHHLPFAAFARLTFDELWKVRYSTGFMMDSSVNAVMEHDPRYQIVHKIQSSMWRWGMGKGVWNEVVGVYDAIRRFRVPVEGLEVRLDHTNSVNERGHARYSRTFLDGVFAFLIYHKGKHVMTLGFSIMADKRLLIHQVQLKNPKGNRWLFGLPSNRLEFFIECFQEAFSDYTLYLVDGAAIANSSLTNYRDQLETVEERIARYRDKPEWRGSALEEQKRLQEKIAHIREDTPRLAAFYRNSGRFQQGEKVKVNGLLHYRLREAA